MFLFKVDHVLAYSQIPTTITTVNFVGVSHDTPTPGVLVTTVNFRTLSSPPKETPYPLATNPPNPPFSSLSLKQPLIYFLCGVPFSGHFT